MVDLRTVLNITNVSTNSVSSGTDYATTLSVDNDDLQLNAEQVTFSDIKTNLAIINDNLSVQEYSDEEREFIRTFFFYLMYFFRKKSKKMKTNPLIKK